MLWVFVEKRRDIKHNSDREMVPNSAISQLGSDHDKISDVKQDNYCYGILFDKHM